jgi:hypothetical protein
VLSLLLRRPLLWAFRHRRVGLTLRAVVMAANSRFLASLGMTRVGLGMKKILGMTGI